MGTEKHHAVSVEGLERVFLELCLVQATVRRVFQRAAPGD